MCSLIENDSVKPTHCNQRALNSYGRRLTRPAWLYTFRLSKLPIMGKKWADLLVEYTSSIGFFDQTIGPPRSQAFQEQLHHCLMPSTEAPIYTCPQPQGPPHF